MSSPRVSSRIFASDPQRAAWELARVCSRRVGLSWWEPSETCAVWERCDGTQIDGDAWSSADGIRELRAE
jgi:hypothetical protein